uniref:LOW QUALITY PROTEIN: rhox homeobox family member 2B-like n=1 Tax=Arvicanthis niloticus TaxID=61156 RepID=UPI00148704EB|nr:LOW QUALITY PROTEIN: rhox homeobox family member 2B-like [Arvicanthis niloticus]
MEGPNINYVLHMRPEEDEETTSGTKALTDLLAGEGRKEEESRGSQPGSGAAAAAEREGAEELSGEGGSAAGAAGLMDNRNQEDNGATGYNQENEKQPEEPVPDCMGDLENVKPVPGQWSCVNPVRVLVPEYHPHQQHRFALLQLQELESILQRNHYISTTEAKRLARSMDVSEARVQKWLLKWREKYRSYKML